MFDILKDQFLSKLSQAINTILKGTILQCKNKFQVRERFGMLFLGSIFTLSAF